jgi:hypothetical protein
VLADMVVAVVLDRFEPADASLRPPSPG